MSKRILIIEKCKDCPHSTNSFAMDVGNTTMGVLSGGSVLACIKNLKHCPSKGVPDWCPLPKLPEYESASVGNIKQKAETTGWNDVYTTGYVYGRNDCLNEIEGGGDNG